MFYNIDKSECSNQEDDDNQMEVEDEKQTQFVPFDRFQFYSTKSHVLGHSSKPTEDKLLMSYPQEKQENQENQEKSCAFVFFEK